MDWEFVYEAFPVNHEMIWLNNCGTTPAGVHVKDAVNRFMDGYSRKGVLTDAAGYTEVQGRIKDILANLLNCNPNELALIHNTAEGMNMVSRGLNLRSGDEIILLENEYPSNVYPWWHWKEKGVDFKTAPMGSDPEAFIEGLQALVTSRTRVISVSMVHWCTGMPLPLDRISRLCKDKDIALVVDGAQGIGMQPLNLETVRIDYMAFPAWKWLLGPLGLGVLYVAEQSLEKLEPVFIGPESVHNPNYLPYKTELKAGADRFAYSTSNFNDWIYFLASLEFLDAIGFERVRQRIYELTDYLNRALRGAGFNVFSDGFADRPTGITVCEHPGARTADIMRGMKKDRIIAADRLDRVRFSPHIYISPNQLDQVVSKLGEIVRRLI